MTTVTDVARFTVWPLCGTFVPHILRRQARIYQENSYETGPETNAIFRTSHASLRWLTYVTAFRFSLRYK